MTSTTSPTYKMTMSLNILRHLGIGLYSNIPAVLSEAIANAWDADAKNVDISIDTQSQKVTIQDDGHGMSVSDANEKYLTVGYERRTSGAAKTPSGRRVMGRKGIGKLSLFSIADVVEVHSVKDNEKHGFRMAIDAIRQAIETGKDDYYPESIDDQSIDLGKGTLITLTTSKKRRLSHGQTGRALKRRLARRFSVMGSEHGFTIKINGEVVSVTDRGYHDKLQYIWTFGEKGEDIARIARNKEHNSRLPSAVRLDEEDAEIDGWIGTVRKPSELKDNGENINGIVIMVRGKLAQENILDEFGDQNLYSEYVIGEIHADFLDQDDKVDIATTSRQRLIEEDPRYLGLRRTLEDHLSTIQTEWRDQRNKVGLSEATKILPQIEQWYQSLNPDHKKAAGRLFGKINQLKIDNEREKGQLFISGIMAFESLRLRNLLNRLDEISPENLGVLNDVFIQLDDLESSAYYEITKSRLEVIEKLNNLVNDDEVERVIQQHLYDHLWLLDPSWERATHTEYMERQIRIALDGVNADLSEEERNARIDIGYATSGNKHVIIELKRASRLLSTLDVVAQLQKYRGAASKVLEQTNRRDQPIELICVIGRPLQDWNNLDGLPQSIDLLRAINARVVMYRELIDNASKAYKDYVDKNKEAGRIYELVKSIGAEYAQSIRPDD